jgi:pimeloyl-ACP methyl ester carboxylesterase
MEGNHQDIEEVLESYLRSGRQAKGMRYSTWIAEELPEEREATIERNQTLFPWLKDYPVNDVSFETAKYWKVKSIFDDRKWPDLSFNGPVLILSGEFDPWTPVSYGQKMKEKFPQATHMIYPKKTHLPGFTRDGAIDIYEFLKSKETSKQ